MRIRRNVTALTLAAGLAAGAAGCAVDDAGSCASDDSCVAIEPARDDDGDELDCEVVEQQVFDEDCGYYDAHQVWVFYPWVTRGVYSKPWPGWQKPARLATKPTGAAPRPSSGTRTQKPSGGSTTRSTTKSTGGRTTTRSR